METGRACSSWSCAAHRAEENSRWSISSLVKDRDVGNQAKALTVASLQLGPLCGAGRGRRRCGPGSAVVRAGVGISVPSPLP